MIIFLYGPDTFRSRAKLAALRNKFVAANPDRRATSYTAAELTPAKIEELTSPTLFAAKRLIVLEGILGSEDSALQKACVQQLGRIPEDTVLVFWEADDADAKSDLFKTLTKQATVQEFKTPTATQIVAWAVQEAAARGVDLPDNIARRLAENCDFNPWQINSELAKLAALAKTQPVSLEVVDQLVTRSLSAKAFDLLDSISAGNLPLAHRLTGQLTAIGEDPLKLLALLAYHLRTLIRVSDVVAAGAQKAAIIQITKLHPFVVQKSMAQVAKLPRPWLVQAYCDIAEADWSIKSGSLDPADALTYLTTRLAQRA